MSKNYDGIIWRNDETPLNDHNLNIMDLGIKAIDNAKIEASELNGWVTEVTYDDKTGVFVFSRKNASPLRVDMNIEKIPTDFSMSKDGVITMTTADGTKYTADIGSMLKEYDFTNTETITLTVTSSGANTPFTVKADINSHSITKEMLESSLITEIEDAEDKSKMFSKDSEAWAKGTRNGIPVAPTDETYQNNAKYYVKNNVINYKLDSTGTGLTVEGGFFPSGKGGGSSVIANPEAEATDTLHKIEIDDVVYDIESGSGADITETDIEQALNLDYQNKTVTNIKDLLQSVLTQFFSNAFPLVPTLVSNMGDNGMAITSGIYGNYEAFKVFDGIDTTDWLSPSGQTVGQWVGYEFLYPVIVTSIAFKNRYDQGGVYFIKKFAIDGADTADFSNYVELCTVSVTAFEKIDNYFINNGRQFKCYRLRVIEVNNSGGCGVSMLQFLGF